MNQQNSIIPTDAQHDAHFHPRCASCDEPFGLVKRCKLTHLDKQYCYDCAPDHNPDNAPPTALPHGARFLTEVELDYYTNENKNRNLLMFSGHVFDHYTFERLHVTDTTFCLLDFPPNPYRILNTYNTAASLIESHSLPASFLTFVLHYPTHALPRDPVHLIQPFYNQ